MASLTPPRSAAGSTQSNCCHPSRAAEKLLSHPEDIHCVLFHLTLVACYILAFLIYWNRARFGIDSLASHVAYVSATALMLGWASGVNVGVNFHNHTHRRIFHSPFINRWFGRFWALFGGWPSFYWQYAHVTVHHAHLLQERDWSLPKRRPDGSFENLAIYCLAHWPWRYAYHLWLDFARQKPTIRRTAAKEVIIFAALWSVPFWIDVRAAVYLWLLPHWIGNVIIMGSGMYVQHVGGEAKSPDSPYGHSNCFRSKLFNLTMFNIGYHIEHHDHPSVHWSELPALHHKLLPEMQRSRARIFGCGYYRAASVVSGWLWPTYRRQKKFLATALVTAPDSAPDTGKADQVS